MDATEKLEVYISKNSFITTGLHTRVGDFV